MFADTQYDAIEFHNFLAQTIVEEGYGIKTDSVGGSTMATFQGVRKGDLHVSMEAWSESQKDMIDDALEAEDIIDLGTNFLDNGQGIYVPTYVIEGDLERGIEPIAPDLRKLEDLKDYADVFVDPENPSRGRIINGPSGWTVQEAISEKINTYGLDETMNDFIPGSEIALVSDLTKAYENGESGVGYYYTPTRITAKYDLTLLEEPEYDEEILDKNKGTAYPINDIIVIAHKDLPEQLPNAVKFLENYEVGTEGLEEVLLCLEEIGKTPEEAGAWWMKKHEDVWTQWVLKISLKK